MTPSVAKEIKFIFKDIEDVSLSKANVVTTDSLKSRYYTLAVIGLKPKKNITEQDRKKITDWLKARLETDSLELIVKRK